MSQSCRNRDLRRKSFTAAKADNQLDGGGQYSQNEVLALIWNLREGM